MLILFHRRVTLAKLARGWVCHSRYDGRPWVASGGIPGQNLPRETAKGLCEPILCLLAGGLLSLASPPLGVLVGESRRLDRP